MATRKNQKHRKNQRREDAAERQAVRNELGDAGQLAKLERQGHGDCKEAKRLRGDEE